VGVRRAWNSRSTKNVEDIPVVRAYLITASKKLA
jgi:hypothetical protein